jgi:GTP-binding protein
MEIKKARFLTSSAEFGKCPVVNGPEYAFIGRSNVGKSSLINMLVDSTSLAKTSTKPGKTRLINHFLIDEEWYLVDLPGYGYAEVPKGERLKWEKLVREYILKRENLYCLFVLIDSRHEPLMIDIEFIHWLGINEIPFALVFTKADKLKDSVLTENIEKFNTRLLETWETMPEVFITSVKGKKGRDEILGYIGKINKG